MCLQYNITYLTEKGILLWKMCKFLIFKRKSMR